VEEEAAAAPVDEVELDEPPLEEYLPDTELETPEGPLEEPPTPLDEEEVTPPTWVVEGVEPEAEEQPEEYDWIPEEALGEIVAEEEVEEKIDLNAASLIQLERLPRIGFRRAQNIIAYRQEHGAFTVLDDLVGIEGVDLDTLDTLREHTTIKPPPPPKPFGTAPLPDSPPEDEYHAKLYKAQALLYEGDLPGALEIYTSLIDAGQRLDETIDDLNQAIFQYPMDVSLLQTLGDAYLRADRLQEALDVYTKAEELLR
jgi:competence ComEA-like helix-hairpin-helix protein